MYGQDGARAILAEGEAAGRLNLTPKEKNWNASIHILGQTWHAFSWQAKEKVSLTQMVARLLRALVCP